MCSCGSGTPSELGGKAEARCRLLCGVWHHPCDRCGVSHPPPRPWPPAAPLVLVLKSHILGTPLSWTAWPGWSPCIYINLGLLHAGRFFTVWATREAPGIHTNNKYAIRKWKSDTQKSEGPCGFWQWEALGREGVRTSLAASRSSISVTKGNWRQTW